MTNKIDPYTVQQCIKLLSGLLDASISSEHSLNPDTVVEQQAVRMPEGYVYGLWVKHPDGKPPVLPIGAEYQMRGRTDNNISEVCEWDGQVTYWANTDYRILYKVGHWYPWDGGECPLPPTTKVQIKLRNGSYRDEDVYTASKLLWNVPASYAPGLDIVSFRIVD